MFFLIDIYTCIVTCYVTSHFKSPYMHRKLSCLSHLVSHHMVKCTYLPTSWLFSVHIYMMMIMVRRYGPEVEGVIIPRPRGGRGPPLHGRVVFKNPLIPRMVMRDREKVCFSIDGRPVYAKRFFSKKVHTGATASTSLRDGGSHPGGDE